MLRAKVKKQQPMLSNMGNEHPLLRHVNEKEWKTIH